MFIIKEELKKLPDKPGVYLMKDKSGKIIYVGKAKVLKNRVKSYFLESKNKTTKTKALVKCIDSFEYIVTESELDALILECSLIKKYRPKFNILLKDDKNYPYIKLSTSEDYPKISKVRRTANDKNKYFGPYVSGFAIKETINLIRSIFQIRDCNRILPRDAGKERPCLNYHIKKCMGPCIPNHVSKEEYAKMINQISDVINGNTDKIEKELLEKMESASKALDFETAATYRDSLMNLKKINEKQSIVNAAGGNLDAIASFRNNTDCCIQLFVVRNGKIVGRKSFMLEGVMDETDGQIIEGFIKQYYVMATSIPDEIAVQDFSAEGENPADVIEITSQWLRTLRGKNVSLNIPKRGYKAGLIELAQENARIALERFLENKLKEEQTAQEALDKLKELLNLPKLPMRIEAYDISNTGDTEIVGSMVVLLGGKFTKKEYRRYKMKQVSGQDDYASMQEMLYRRLSKLDDEEKRPDLILIDGGLNHISAVKMVMDSVGEDVSIAGMVKDNKHQSRGLIQLDGKEFELKQDLSLFRFITSIQNETHRYAIEYNKALRSRRYKTSVLDNIPGIGEKRKQALIIHFGSISNIKNATMKQLLEVKGITEPLARRIREFFGKYE